jgi:protein TonB
LPLLLSIAGHAVALALLILFAVEIRPSPNPAVPGGIEVVLSPSLRQAPALPAPEAPAQPAPPSVAAPPPEPAAVAEPERTVEATEPPPAPPVAAETEIPLPPRRPVVREPPKHVMRRPERPRASVSVPALVPAKFAEMGSAGIAGAQNSAAPAAAAVAAPAPVPGPDVTASYRAMISAWLESHKRYPESARQRGEEGSAALRFRPTGLAASSTTAMGAPAMPISMMASTR